MKFSVMHFGASETGADQAELLQLGRLSDELGFAAMWIPERHFSPFGSAFPNPAVIAAAVAAQTSRIEVRAGSVVSPLHDVIRVAEEWAVVDCVSDGRAGLSFGSGWNADDFVLAPDAYDGRRELMWEQIEHFRTLWHGGEIERVNGRGKATAVRTYPRPVRRDVPLWVTVSGSPETARQAARHGFGMLTHLVGKSRDDLASLVAEYWRHRADRSGPGVTLMLHAFASPSRSYATSVARDPLREYLRSAVTLELAASRAGGTQSGGRGGAVEDGDSDAVEELLAYTTDQYLESRSMIGDRRRLSEMVGWCEDIGISEIACLIDFGVEPAEIEDSLRHISTWLVRNEEKENSR